MKVAIYGQQYNEKLKECIEYLITEMLSMGYTLVIEVNYSTKLCKTIPIVKELPTYQGFEDLNNSYNLMVSIGGDGTILRAATLVRNLPIPILGINTGRLGFLATVQQEDIKHMLECLKARDYTISERSLVELHTSPDIKELNGLYFALNEIAVSRKNTASMITVSTFLNGEYLTSYWADGLIVSTPTGSTGYSLSCGGPVIMPTAHNLVLTPIAPHNLNARPLVIADNTEIKLSVSGREKNYLISLDSRQATLSNETEIIIRKAPFTIKFIDLKTESFLKTLRNKLLWGEDKRN